LKTESAFSVKKKEEKACWKEEKKKTGKEPGERKPEPDPYP